MNRERNMVNTTRLLSWGGRRLSALLPVLLLLLLPREALPTPSGAAAPLQEQLAGIERYYGSLSSLKFGFQQTSHSGGSQRLGNGTGLLYKERDPSSGTIRGMMRWDYLEPEQQVIISDGATLSVYTPEDRQMIVTSSSQLENDMLYRLFLRERELLADFIVLSADTVTAEGGAMQSQSLRLEPRQPHPQIREVQLWLDGACRIQRLRMRDQFGGETQLILGQMEENPLKGSSPEQIRAMFQLKPPGGTEIIHN